MIDTSKLKYYKTLCEKGVIAEQQNNLDEIMDALEEKQFEYLKRLETTKDESRKDEINELLSIIDLQLKEIGSLKSAISSGIIIESVDSSAKETKTDTKQENAIVTENESKHEKKGKTGLIVAVIALIAVVVIAATFMFNNKGNQNTSDNTSTANSENSTNDEENKAKIGLYTFTAEEVRQAWKDMGEEDDWDYLLDGSYIYDITNQHLIDGGVQIGDRVITLNGENVKTADDLTNIVSKYKPGDEAVLVVARGFEQLTINAVFISAAETLEPRNSGEEIVEIDGRPYRFAYSEDGLSINAWKFPDE